MSSHANKIICALTTLLRTYLLVTICHNYSVVTYNMWRYIIDDVYCNVVIFRRHHVVVWRHNNMSGQFWALTLQNIADGISWTSSSSSSHWSASCSRRSSPASSPSIRPLSESWGCYELQEVSYIATWFKRGLGSWGKNSCHARVK